MSRWPPATEQKVLVQLYLTPELHARLTREAASRDLAMAAVVRELLTLGLKDHDEEAA